ncbi:response regulator [Clostridium sp. PL3]|uniref:Response regulator n=1 Tax=Clostridium thailandense TaxID=2794346 RepID=A0A949TXH5_9CLOT|nr:response regulator [Clostridium thailandense]MBV7273370.1 response regulator [Clostridium thailandense]
MGKGYKILIVDYEEETINSITENLITEGYSVETCTDSLKALDKFKSEKYHVVIIDVGMPHMNGIDLLREVKFYDALTQVIMVSEHSTMDNVIQALELGANDYILEPFKSIEVLVETVKLSIKKLERWKETIRKIVE